MEVLRMKEIAFIINNDLVFPKIFEIQVNPNMEQIERMKEICEARGGENHRLVYLTQENIRQLEMFM